MNYYNTAGGKDRYSFRDALLAGPAPGGGLFMPQTLPRWTTAEWEELLRLPITVSGARVLHPFLQPHFSMPALEALLEDTLSFPLPLVEAAPGVSVLETFHGPTLAFKDLGARFLSRCLRQLRPSGSRLTVLVATSGDTGGAVAAGFAGLPDVEVVILYPEGRVSPVQELQLLRAGPNVTALRVGGSFDDCQRMVKSALTNGALKSALGLTSANSINVARWLPQTLFYLAALQQWKGAPLPPISIPSGNFGNLAAALLLKRCGLPCGRLLAACNENDPVPRFLAGGPYAPEGVRPTLSNAMDVAAPSNFVRLLSLGGEAALRHDAWGCRVSDRETEDTMRSVFRKYGYTLDPHTAVAWKAAAAYAGTEGKGGTIVVATAHPVKFAQEVERITGHSVPIPISVSELRKREERVLPLEPRTEALFRFLERV